MLWNNVLAKNAGLIVFVSFFINFVLCLHFFQFLITLSILIRLSWFWYQLKEQLIYRKKNACGRRSHTVHVRMIPYYSVPLTANLCSYNNDVHYKNVKWFWLKFEKFTQFPQYNYLICFLLECVDKYCVSYCYAYNHASSSSHCVVKKNQWDSYLAIPLFFSYNKVNNCLSLEKNGSLRAGLFTTTWTSWYWVIVAWVMLHEQRTPQFHYLVFISFETNGVPLNFSIYRMFLCETKESWIAPWRRSWGSHNVIQPLTWTHSLRTKCFFFTSNNWITNLPSM